MMRCGSAKLLKSDVIYNDQLIYNQEVKSLESNRDKEKNMAFLKYNLLLTGRCLSLLSV